MLKVTYEQSIRMFKKLLWLENVFYGGEKLTSKDKLVAAFLMTSKRDGECYLYNPESVARNSGLALRTVQKSIGRLSAIGYITFLTDKAFIFEVY